MKKLLLSILFFLLSLSAFAQEKVAPVKADALVLSRLETVNGTVYENLKEVKVMAKGIVFQRAGGQAAVRLENLPLEIRVALGYHAPHKSDRLIEASEYAALEKIAAENNAKKKMTDREATMQTLELSRAVSHYVRYEDYYRWKAAQQREQDLRDAMDARYLKYGR